MSYLDFRDRPSSHNFSLHTKTLYQRVIVVYSNNRIIILPLHTLIFPMARMRKVARLGNGGAQVRAMLCDFADDDDKAKQDDEVADENENDDAAESDDENEKDNTVESDGDDPSEPAPDPASDDDLDDDDDKAKEDYGVADENENNDAAEADDENEKDDAAESDGDDPSEPAPDPVSNDDLDDDDAEAKQDDGVADENQNDDTMESDDEQPPGDDDDALPDSAAPVHIKDEDEGDNDNAGLSDANGTTNNSDIAQPLEDSMGDSDTGKSKYPDNDEDEKSLKAWLLATIPKLNQHDLEAYSRGLGEIGFHSECVTMCELKYEDLGFMKLLHRRYLFNEVTSIEHPWDMMSAHAFSTFHD